MHKLNGSHAEIEERPLRFIWFGGSIISDWNNPIATTNRAVIRALQEAGHDVLFFEASDNDPFLDALKGQGSALYRAFQEAYPDIRYRRYQLPVGSEGDVWLGRESALADVMIVQDDAPGEITDWLTRIPPAQLVKLQILTIGEPAPNDGPFDMILSPRAGNGRVQYGPAVSVRPVDAAARRNDTIVVVYDDATLPASAPGDDLTVIATGSNVDAPAEYIPEALLPQTYEEARQVVLCDSSTSPFAAARQMLVAASGAALISEPGGLPERVDVRDAGEQAKHLIDVVASVRSRRVDARS